MILFIYFNIRVSIGYQLTPQHSHNNLLNKKYRIKHIQQNTINSNETFINIMIPINNQHFNLLLLEILEILSSTPLNLPSSLKMILSWPVVIYFKFQSSCKIWALLLPNTACKHTINSFLRLLLLSNPIHVLFHKM